MPRKKIKPTPWESKSKYNKFIKVKYEQLGKRKIFEMDIPVIGEITINSALEPLIAKRLGCDSTDIFLVDKNDFEPFMVTNPVVSENEVQE